MEKVSVIVPVYNGEKSIQRCSDSILNQDYPELELILVDDGSRDRSWEIMQAIASADGRVKAVHQENGGVSSARNRALAEASGTYVQFADADDWLPMDATKLLVRDMEAKAAELAVGDFYRVAEGNVSEKGSIQTGGTLSLRQYANEMMLAPADLYYGVLWNKLYRRDIIERYGIRMDENISYSEDMIFNLEYLLHVNTVAILKAPVYYYQYTKGSLVDQSLNLSSTIKMKKSVIGYYNEFFRKTFDAPAYQERLPVIYSYLLAVRHDSLALPFAPGTRKMKEDAALAAKFDACKSLDEMIELVNVFIDDHELDFTSAFAYNRSVLFVPYPIPPTGLVRSGLLTLTRKQMESAERIQLPNADKWPARLVGFKHCLLVERLPVQNSDRKLVLINLQTDAGSSSQGKSEQEKAILGFLQEEADKGNYVIAAGEFDQTFSDADGSLLKYYPEGGCVLSSNIEVRSCERKKAGSEYAGHEPVLLECVLR